MFTTECENVLLKYKQRPHILNNNAFKICNELVSGIKMHLINKEIYGYMMPPYENQENLTDIQAMFTNAKLEYFGKRTQPITLTSFRRPHHRMI